MIGILGTGLIGSALEQALRGEGIPLRVLSKSRPHDPESGVFQGNVTNPDSLSAFFEEIDTLVITFHEGVPKTKESVARNEVKQNVIGNLNVLEKCSDYGISKILYLSSGGAVYGVPQAEVVDENHPTEPVSPYGISKMMIEQFMKHHHRVHGTDVLIVRPSNVVADQFIPNGFGVINKIFECLKNESTFNVWGDGKGRKDYVSLADTVVALSAILTKGFDGFSVYNLASGDARSVNALIARCETISAKKLNVEYSDVATQDVPEIIIAGDKLSNDFAPGSVMSVDQCLESIWTSMG